MLPIAHPRPLPCVSHFYEFGVYPQTWQFYYYITIFLFPALSISGIHKVPKYYMYILGWVGHVTSSKGPIVSSLNVSN